MSVESATLDRIAELLEQGRPLAQTNEHGQALNIRQMGECAGWVAAALNAVERACGGAGAYWDKARVIETASRGYGYTMPRAVTELSSLLEHLSADIRGGFLGTVADAARAETFDNFLDHGAAYLAQQRVREAGVIAGVVFEDAVRRVCRNVGIEEKDVNVDSLISALVKNSVLTEVKAKRARVAAGVRTKATHAQWDEFSGSDVSATIDFTRELIAAQLDG